MYRPPPPKPARLLPQPLRPKLHRSQVLHLHLLHAALLDTLASPDAGPVALWEFVAMTLTYTRVAELLGRGGHLIAPTAELAADMVLRYRATGEVRIGGHAYQLARMGCMVMDAFAEHTDAHTAEQAATWSEQRLAVMRAVVELPKGTL